MSCGNCDSNPKILAVNRILSQYADKDGSLITILQKVQEEYGYLSADILSLIARETGIKLAKIIGVATFYTQFRLEPVGRHVILLCQGTACHVNGSEAIAAAVTSHLNVEDGKTTSDGMFTLTNVACLGCCSLSPVMMVDGETYGSLTPEKTLKILDEIREVSK